MKALGIGLIVAAVAKLSEAMSRNQKVVDVISKAFETVSIVMSEVITAVDNAFQSVSQLEGGFKNSIAVINGLITLALTPFKVAVDGLKLGILLAKRAYEESMFGSGDPETIKALTEEIENTRESLKETGDDALDAGKSIADNFGGMMAEMGDLYLAAEENISKISTDSAKASADRIVELRNEAKLAEAQLGGLTLKFQQQAEVLRQERDDIRLSIEDRIKANEELGKVLQKQAEEELKLANKRLALAEEELALNPKNIEKQKALQEALNGVAEVEERITGQKSEQRVNEAALFDERKANLEELRKLGLTEQELAKQESQNELENQKQLIERTVTNEKEKKRLLELAEEEHQTRLNEIDATKTKEKNEILGQIEEENDLQKLEKQKEKDLAELERLEATEAEKQRIRDFYSDKEEQLKEDAKQNEINIERAKARQTLEIISQTSGQISNILNENSKAAKAFAIAEALINTYLGITAGVKLGFPAAIPAVIAAATTGFKAVKDIVSTNVENPSASGGGAARPSTASRGASSQQQQVQAPEFNIVGDSGTNQIAEVLGQQSKKPQKAFVVSKEVSSQQELDRNIETSASLG